MAREATAGVDLPATAVMVVEEFGFTSDSERASPRTARGLLIRNRGHEHPIRYAGRWSASGPATYEQLQYFLCMVQNVAAPTGAGPYVWTHTRPVAANPTPATFCFEKRETDGSSPYVQVAHYCTLDRFKLSGAPTEDVMSEAEGFSRKIQTGEAFTAGLTPPTPEFMPFTLSKVFIDANWAGLGGTQVSAQVIAWEVEHQAGIYPRFTADGRTDLDWNALDYNPDNVQINASITCLLGAQYAAEIAAAAAQSLRAVRIQIDGTSSRQLQIDFLAKYELPEIPEFGEDEGARIVTLNLVDSSDGTNFLRYKLTNNVATLI